MGFFDTLVKKAGNEFASRAIDNANAPPVGFIDTGSYSLNAAICGSIYGGIPKNKAVALAGEESTGKSFYALSVCQNFQTEHPDGAVFYFESEGYLDRTSRTTELLKSRGIDPARFYIMPVVTIQEFRTQAMKLMEEYAAVAPAKRSPMLFVLDSLGNLSTIKEISDMVDGKDVRDMTKAQLVKGTFRALTLRMNMVEVPLIVINHVYNVIGSYVPMKDMGGGSGLKYAASITLFLSKSKAKDKDNNITGAVITVRVKKSRLTREEKEIDTLLDHNTGLDRYYGLLQIAADGGLIEQIGAKCKASDGSIGAKFKFADGTEEVETIIYKNPTKYFTKTFLDQIDQVAKTVFEYGKTQESEEEDDVE